MGRGGGSSGGGFCSRSREVGGGRRRRRKKKAGWREGEREREVQVELARMTCLKVQPHFLTVYYKNQDRATPALLYFSLTLITFAISLFL